MFKFFKKEISVDLTEVLKCLETSFSAKENGDIYSSKLHCHWSLLLMQRKFLSLALLSFLDLRLVKQLCPLLYSILGL